MKLYLLHDDGYLCGVSENIYDVRKWASQEDNPGVIIIERQNNGKWKFLRPGDDEDIKWDGVEVEWL